MLIEIEWHPTGRQLRVFGVSGLLASVAAALVLFFLWGAAVLWAAVVLAAGGVIFLCSLVSPKLARILFIALALAALPIGLVVSLLLLAAFYFLLLTPLAFVFRLTGRDALRRRLDAGAESYWVPHPTGDDPERYFHQS